MPSATGWTSGSAGSTWEVWAATDLELDRRVALKLLASDADPVRFEREARAIAALAGPEHLRTFTPSARSDGRPFIVLEYLPGGSLDERMTYGKPVPDAFADQLAREIAAEALSMLTSAGSSTAT